jgi:hypothetical protein
MGDDTTVMSVAVAETGFDLDKRCAFVKRYDPRYVYWQLSNDNDRRVIAFWAVFPITEEECEKNMALNQLAESLRRLCLATRI